MDNAEKGIAEIDIREIFFVVWERIVTVVLVGLLCAAVAFLFTQFFITPQYTSTASIYVMNRQQDNGQLTSSELSVSTTLTSDFKILITTRTVLEQVIEDVGLNVSTVELAGKISVSNPADTRILKITVADADAYLAKQIADSLALVSAEQIQIIMGIERVSLIETAAVAVSPSSPNLRNNVILGAAAGVLLTILIIVVLHILDDSLKTPGDVEQQLGVSVLGVIPMSSTEIASMKKGKKNKKKKLAFSRLS